MACWASREKRLYISCIGFHQGDYTGVARRCQGFLIPSATASAAGRTTPLGRRRGLANTEGCLASELWIHPTIVKVGHRPVTKR
jgi:hypothetical protein